MRRFEVQPSRAWRHAAFALAAFVALVDVSSARSGVDDASTQDPQLVAKGRRIYREGVLPSGVPLRATAQSNVQRLGEDAACAACHRRSGFGTAEGSFAIRTITGPSLFGWQSVSPAAPPARAGTATSPANPADAARAARMAVRNARVAALSGTRQRPPYDDVSLARAIREGVDVSGRRLSTGMPRYDLDDEAMKSLVAYLKTLSAQSSAGVTDEEIHFATVIQPGVDGARRRAMLDVLRAFIQDKNAGTRSEMQRREAGTERMYRAYRKWVLHVWELAGSSDTWPSQLEAFYGAQPVFALISGLGTTSWRPVHDFSERFEVPCLFPQTDMPVLDAPGFYTVYYSRGVALEAEALAKFLDERGEAGRVTQVYRSDAAASAAAADALRNALRERTGASPHDRVLDGPSTNDDAWRKLVANADTPTLVLWLPSQDLPAEGVFAGTGSRVDTVYLSSTLLSGKRPALATAADVRLRMVYPLDLPLARESRLLGTRRWLQGRGIAVTDEKVQMNAYFALTVTADAVMHTVDTYSRDYLVERIEHMVGNTVAPSLYPHVSLGPGQRFASKGSFIVQAGGSEDRQLKTLSGWIVP